MSNSMISFKSKPISIPTRNTGLYTSNESSRPSGSGHSSFGELFQNGCKVSVSDSTPFTARVKGASQNAFGEIATLSSLQSSQIEFPTTVMSSSSKDLSGGHPAQTLVDRSTSLIFSLSFDQSLETTKQPVHQKISQEQGMLNVDPEPISPQKHTHFVQMIGRSSTTFAAQRGDSFIKNLAKKPLSESLNKEGLFLIKVSNEAEYESFLQSLNNGKNLESSSEIASGVSGTAYRIFSKHETLVVKKGSPVKIKRRLREARDKGAVEILDSSLENLIERIKTEIETWKAMIQTKGLYGHEKTTGLCFPKPKLILTYVETVKNGLDTIEKILRYSIVLTDMGPDMFSICKNALLGEKPYPDSFVEFAKIFARQLTGLSIFQKHGFIHRDVKPENLTPFGWIDNGFAVKIKKGEKITGFVGSYEEMPPEMILGIPYGKKIDSFSFSCSALTSFLRHRRPISLKKYCYDPRKKIFVKIPYDIINIDDPRITPQNVYLYTQRANHLFLMEKLIGKFPKNLIKQCSERVRNLFFYQGDGGEYSLRHGYHHYDINRGIFALEPFSYDYVNQALQLEGADFIIVQNPRNRNAPYFMKCSTGKYINKQPEHTKAIKQVLRLANKVKSMFKHYSELVNDASKKRQYSSEQKDLFLKLLEGGLQLDPEKRFSVDELLYHPYTSLSGPIVLEESKMK